MNGVVHQCRQGAAASEEELLMATFQYIEGLVDIVRPKKYLFIALDGTIPSDLPAISLPLLSALAFYPSLLCCSCCNVLSFQELLPGQSRVSNGSVGGAAMPRKQTNLLSLMKKMP